MYGWTAILRELSLLRAGAQWPTHIRDVGGHNICTGIRDTRLVYQPCFPRLCGKKSKLVWHTLFQICAGDDFCAIRSRCRSFQYSTSVKNTHYFLSHPSTFFGFTFLGQRSHWSWNFVWSWNFATFQVVFLFGFDHNNHRGCYRDFFTQRLLMKFVQNWV